MSLRSLFGLDSPFSYVQAVQKYGLRQLAEVMTIIVRAKFSQDMFVRMGQVGQFVREEADAMARAGGYPAEVAKKMLGDESNYAGAMNEEADFPIDYPGGPQQTLLTMTLDFMKETGGGADLPVRFRCAVVENIFALEAMLARMASGEDVDWDCVSALKRNVEIADDILGQFLKKHRSYFGKFINSGSL